MSNEDETMKREAAEMIVVAVDAWRDVPEEMRGFVVGRLLEIRDGIKRKEQDARARGLTVLDAHADRLSVVFDSINAAAMLLDLIVFANVVVKEES